MTKFIISFIVLFSGMTFGIEGDGKWISDWPNLLEVGQMVTSARISGVTDDGLSYVVDISTKIVSYKDLKTNGKLRYFGLNRNGDDAPNTQITKLEFVIEGKKMRIPEAAIIDVLNPLIGQRMEIIFSADKHRIRAIILNGPDGAEGYMVAFVFKNGKFFRRQIRPNHASEKGWELLDDKKY